MRFRTVAVPAALAAVVLTAPAGAQAATLTAAINKPCYGSGDRVGLVAAGFTPGAPLRFAFGSFTYPATLPANAAGGAVLNPIVPPLSTAEQTAPFTASDGVNRAASAPVRASNLNVAIKPKAGRPAGRRRIRARGFTTGGGSLYAHITRGRSKRNVRIGGLKGPCKTTSARRRLFRPGRFRVGTYRIQFDAFRRSKATREQKFVFRFRIFHVVRPRPSAGAASLAETALAESWTRVR